MSKLPSRQALLSAAILSTLVIAGCDVDSGSEVPVANQQTGTPTPAVPGCTIIDAATGACALVLTVPDVDGVPGPDYYVPGTYARFNPASSDLPFNTDILFSGSTDGTALISGSDPVRNAVNDLDGWSTSAAFNVLMSGSLNPASVVSTAGATQNVFLIPLETVAGGDALNPAQINTSAPFNPANIAATAFRADAISIDGGTNNAIRITPTAPLMAKKKYLVVVTNGVRSAGNAPLAASPSYELLGAGSASACGAQGINVALHPICDAIGGWEQLAVGYLQARNAAVNSAAGSAVLPTDAATLRSSLALTYTFTTTDPTATMIGMAAPRAALVQAAVGAGKTAGEGIALANGLQGAGLLSTPAARAVSVNAATALDLGTVSGGAVSSGVGDLYTGAITLPYYQATPIDSGFFTTGWTADQTLGASLSAAMGLSGANAIPRADNDGTFNVTYRYPFAGKRNTNGVVKVPLQVTLPDPAFVPTNPAFGGASCGMVQGAQGGYPVVIYVHGITSDRTSVIGLAHSLASNCVATVAIDLPLHGVASGNALFDTLNVQNPDGDAAPIPFQTLYTGVAERHFNLKTAANGSPVPMTHDGTDGSGALFINLAYGVNSRDNIRQAVMDLLNLNASLGSISALNIDGVAGNDLNLNKVYVVGVSLGGMIGSVFAATNGQARAAEASLGFASNLNPLQGAVLSVAGGQITKVLENSQAFSPQILGGLAAGGVNIGTENFERFMYAFQSIVDPADPVSFAAPLAASNLPLILQEIVGGADLSGVGDTSTYVADKVVPNSATPPLNAAGYIAPLAGTDPFATLLGATTRAAGAHDATTGTPLLIRLTAGHHGSLLRPSETGAAAKTGENITTAEMHTQVVSFILTGGTGVMVGAGASGAGANVIGN